MNLNLRRLRREARIIRSLLTIGTLVTACERVSEDGFRVIYGNANEDRTLLRARLEDRAGSWSQFLPEGGPGPVRSFSGTKRGGPGEPQDERMGWRRGGWESVGSEGPESTLDKDFERFRISSQTDSGIARKAFTTSGSN